MVEICEQPGDLSRAVRFAGARGLKLALHRGRPVKTERWWKPFEAALAGGDIGWTHVRVPHRGTRRPKWRRSRQGRTGWIEDRDRQWEEETGEAIAGALVKGRGRGFWSWEQPLEWTCDEASWMNQVRADAHVDRVVFPWCRWGGVARRYTRLGGNIPWLMDLGGVCRGGHQHRSLARGVTRHELRYPAPWCDQNARSWADAIRCLCRRVEEGDGSGAKAPSGPKGPYAVPSLAPRRLQPEGRGRKKEAAFLVETLGR